MERVFFLAAHFTLFLTLVAWALQGPKIEFRRELFRSVLALCVFTVAVFAIGFGVDHYFPPELNGPGFLPVAATVASLYGVGAAGAFFSMGFHYSEYLARPGYGALALATSQFLLAVAHTSGIIKESLNFLAALNFTFAVATLIVHKTRKPSDDQQW